MRGMILFVLTLAACGGEAPAPTTEATPTPAAEATPAATPAEGTAAATPAEGTAAPAAGVTKDALVKAKGEIMPLMNWTDVDGKTAALGAPTKATADMKSWSVKTGDKCDVLNVTNSGGVVGNVELQEGVACP